MATANWTRKSGTRCVRKCASVSDSRAAGDVAMAHGLARTTSALRKAPPRRVERRGLLIMKNGSPRVIIQLEQVQKTYFLEGDNQVHALCGVDLKIEEGSFVAIMGPSGSGKSTMLN